MKYCLRSRVSNGFLVKADEIRVDYRDIESIPDLYHKYQKTIILFPPLDKDNTDYNWEKINQLSSICEQKLIVSCLTVQDVIIAKSLSLRIMFAAEARTEWELEGMLKYKPEYVYVGMPMFFNLEATKQKYNVKFRAIPSIAYNHHYPHGNPVCGQWIRPEDVDAYEGLIDVLEFEFCDVRREEALFRVYAIEKTWNTRLDILIEDIQSDAINRYIDPKLIEARINCRQRCYNGGICHLCETILGMACENKMEKILPKLEKNKK